MMQVREVQEWLARLNADDDIGIDDGGLALRCFQTEDYIEVGGLPEECDGDFGCDCAAHRVAREVNS